MKAEFWHERWESNQLGFHQSEVNPLLVEYWPALSLPAKASVFVPLCGKSLDMRWLREQGHEIRGVEFSPIACRDFFDESGIVPIVDEPAADDGLIRYSGDGYTLMCGDFFALESKDLAGVQGVFDRASLIALPPETRRRYAAHMVKILPIEASILLITLSYDQSEMKGPPHSVSDEEVHALYEDAFQIEQLFATGPSEPHPRFRERGVSSWSETVWRLTRSQ